MSTDISICPWHIPKGSKFILHTQHRHQSKIFHSPPPILFYDRVLSSGFDRCMLYRHFLRSVGILKRIQTLKMPEEEKSIALVRDCLVVFHKEINKADEVD